MVHESTKRIGSGTERTRGERGRMRPRVRLVLACLGLLVSLWPVVSQAAATGGVDPRRVAAEINRTERVIQRARQVVRAASASAGPSSEARSFAGVAEGLLRAAVKLQESAKREAQRGAYQAALKLTLEARRQAVKAIGAARSGQTAEATARRRIEEAERRLKAATSAVGSDDRPAAAVLEQAASQVEKAKAAFRRGRYVEASRLALLAMQLLDRAIEDARRAAADRRSAEAAIRNTRRLLDAVADRVEAGNEKGQSLLEQCSRLLDRAEKALAEGRPAASLRLSILAHEMLVRLLDEVAAQPAAAQVERMIEESESFARAIEMRLGEDATSEQRASLDEAHGLLTEARKLLRTGHTREALRSLAAAESVLKDLARSCGI